MATPEQLTAFYSDLETRQANVFQENFDDVGLKNLYDAEMHYWHVWEFACKFNDENLQTMAMKRIDKINELKNLIRTEKLNR